MAYSDKHLVAFIWGLFFIILSLPVFAAEPITIFNKVMNHQSEVTESIPAKTLRLSLLK